MNPMTASAVEGYSCVACIQGSTWIAFGGARNPEGDT